MSQNFRWAMPNIEHTITTPAGDSIVLRVDRDDPRYHIGKQSGGCFSWAQERHKVEATCRAHLEEVIVHGDYYSLTGAEFIEYIASMERHDITHIGKAFS